MSVLIYLGLFFAYGLAVRPVSSLPLSPGVLFTAQLVLGIGWLVIPLAAFSAIDRAWWKRHVRGVAQDWCSSTGIDFKRSELHKNHFTAVGVADGKNVRRRFRMSRRFLVWSIGRVEWLDPERPVRGVMHRPAPLPKSTPEG